MRVFGLILALAITGCASAPDRFGSTEPVIVKVEDVTFAVQRLSDEAYSEIEDTDGFIRTFDTFEEVDLHRRAVETATKCRVTSHAMQQGSMLADLQC